jgi:glycosyltransferase involved in cell wall biosynthesis
VRPADPAALAAAVAALLGDAERRAAYGARSRERFLERFTLDRSTAAMIDLYRRVTARPAADLATQPAEPR